MDELELRLAELEQVAVLENDAAEICSVDLCAVGASEIVQAADAALIHRSIACCWLTAGSSI